MPKGVDADADTEVLSGVSGTGDVSGSPGAGGDGGRGRGIVECDFIGVSIWFDCGDFPVGTGVDG